MADTPRRPTLHLKLAPTAAPSAKPVAAAPATPDAPTWKCKPCGKTVPVGADLDDEAVVRCPSCNARLGLARDFRQDPPSPKLRARRVGERAVSVTALAGCDRARDGRGCEGDAENSTLSSLLFNRHDRAACITRAIARVMHAARSGPSVSAPEIRLPHEPAPSSRRTPHVPGVSWRPQPARAATRRPGRNKDCRTTAKRPAPN